ncbi:MAG TPA: tyrosine-type recombinase/integrase [Chthoniobacter sp.]|jgi:integrase
MKMIEPQNCAEPVAVELSGDRTKALDSLLTREEFLEMMKAGNDSKDKAILCLGVLGLRASEISACEAPWVDFSNRTIVIPPRAAKRGKDRIVPFGKIKVVSEVIIAFFALEHRIGISRIAIWNRVKRMASAAAIKHPVTPHGLRATGATWFAQAGYSITGLQHHFGWSELRTAQHYVQASGASAIRDMEEKGEKVF